MEPEVLAGMIFTLILATLVGGFILLYPLSRRLGALLESRLEDKKPQSRLPDAELAALRDGIEQLGNEVRRIHDRQDFIEKLMAARVEPTRLPTSTIPGNDRS